MYSIRRTPRIIEFLYDRLSSQCKQCGIRFPDTNEGKKTMDDHLDMHFRQNRKANQNIGRGHSRSWFIGIEVSIKLCYYFVDSNEYFRTGYKTFRVTGKEKGEQMGLVL
jgi:hypothetical protein